MIRKKTLRLAVVALSGMMMCSCVQLTNKLTSMMVSPSRFEYKDSEKLGRVIGKDLTVPDFSSLCTSGVLRVVWTQDSVCSVRLEGNENNVNEYVCKVVDGSLKIKVADGSTSFNHTSPYITAYVSSPDLSKADFYGACRFEMPGSARLCLELEIESSGVCDMAIDKLQVGKLSIEQNGTGNIEIADVMTHDDIDFEMSGAGNLKANVKCRSLSVELNGACNAVLSGECAHLKVDENGASDVDFTKLKR